jgi:hypothetical protein
MKKCPQCSGDHPIFKDYGNGKCPRCYEVKNNCAMLRAQKGGLDLTGVADAIERYAIEWCPDCYGTSTCQYCMGFGFVL